MNVARIAVVCMIALAGLEGFAAAAVIFDDGGHHVVDYAINTLLRVDPDAPGAGTTVELVSGGSVTAWVDAYENSRFTLSGGRIGSSLNARDNSHVTVVAGEIGSVVYARDNSRLDISGGSIDAWLSTHDNSEANISGGYIDGSVKSWSNSRITISGGIINDGIAAIGDSLMTLVGKDFEVDGVRVNDGDFVSTYSRRGSIKGVLANGDALDVEFHLNGFDADILFVPEPGTILMLGLGGVAMLGKRRKIR